LFNKIDLNCYVFLPLDKLLVIIFFNFCAFFSFISNTSIDSINSEQIWMLRMQEMAFLGRGETGGGYGGGQPPPPQSTNHLDWQGESSGLAKAIKHVIN
jgi:hypothetical protein